MRVRDEHGTNHKWDYGRSLETAQTIGEQFKPFPYSERLRPQLRERARWFPTDVFRGRPCLRKRRQHRAALPPERTFHKNAGAAREARDFCDGCYFQFVFVAYFLIDNLTSVTSMQQENRSGAYGPERIYLGPIVTVT
jgi:hypothetical protein